MSPCKTKKAHRKARTSKPEEKRRRGKDNQEGEEEKGMWPDHTHPNTGTPPQVRTW